MAFEKPCQTESANDPFLMFSASSRALYISEYICFFQVRTIQGSTIAILTIQIALSRDRQQYSIIYIHHLDALISFIHLLRGRPTSLHLFAAPDEISVMEPLFATAVWISMGKTTTIQAVKIYPTNQLLLSAKWEIPTCTTLHIGLSRKTSSV